MPHWSLPPKLQTAVLFSVEIKEVVALHKLVRKFGKRHALLRLAAEAFLHRVLRHHIVYCDVFAHIADEVEKAEVLHPVVVVYKFGCVGGIGVEVKKAGKLLFDCLLIMAQSFFVEEFALLRFMEGSPIMPVAPPTRAMGLCPAR